MAANKFTIQQQNGKRSMMDVVTWLKWLMVGCAAMLVVRAGMGPGQTQATPVNHPAATISHSVTTTSYFRGVNEIDGNQASFPVDFHIIILGYKRWKSLQRLLTSLDQTDYLGDNVHLHIHIDGGHGRDWDETVRIASESNWKFGPKTVQVSPTHRGLAASWFDAWHPESDEERAIILEDDLEVSPVFYRWLKLMQDNYDDRPEIGGYTLQRQRLVATTGKSRTVMAEGRPFAYKLLGSWGFAPSAKHWRQFLKLDFKKLNPSVKGLITTKWFRKQKRSKMWTQFWIWYCDQHSLYNIYVTPPNEKALASNHRERGVHFSKAKGRDFESLGSDEWVDEWDFPPKAIELYSWDLEKVGMSLPPGFVGEYIEEVPSPRISNGEALPVDELQEVTFESDGNGEDKPESLDEGEIAIEQIEKDTSEVEEEQEEQEEQGEEETLSEDEAQEQNEEADDSSAEEEEEAEDEEVNAQNEELEALTNDDDSQGQDDDMAQNEEQDEDEQDEEDSEDPSNNDEVLDANHGE